MIVAAAIAACLLLLGGLLLIWHVERDRLFSVFSKTPGPIDTTTRALVPIWWLSVTLMLNTTSGLQGAFGFAVTSLFAAIVLLACARGLAKANKGGAMLDRPRQPRRLLQIALFMLSFGAAVALFDAAESFSAYRQAGAGIGADQANQPARLGVQ